MPRAKKIPEKVTEKVAENNGETKLPDKSTTNLPTTNILPTNGDRRNDVISDDEKVSLSLWGGDQK